MYGALLKNVKMGIQLEKAQATVEFSFAMIVAIMLLIGMIRVFVWVGTDLAGQRKAHQDFLIVDVNGIAQTEPSFYYSSPIGATFDSSLNP